MPSSRPTKSTGYGLKLLIKLNHEYDDHGIGLEARDIILILKSRSSHAYESSMLDIHVLRLFIKETIF